MAAKTRRLISNIYRQNRQKAISGGNVNSMQDTQGAVAGALEAEYNVDANRRFNYDQMASNNANAAANRALDSTRINAQISYNNDLLDQQKDASKYAAIKEISAADWSGMFQMGDPNSTNPSTSGTTVSSNKGTSTSPAISESGTKMSIDTGFSGTKYDNPGRMGTAIEGVVNAALNPNIYSITKAAYNTPLVQWAKDKLLTALFSPGWLSTYTKDYGPFAEGYKYDNTETPYDYKSSLPSDEPTDDWSVATAGTGGDSGGDSSRVVCTELHRQGIIDSQLYKAERIYGLSLDTTVIKGYHHWAIPLVRKMRKSKLLTKMVYFVAKPMIYAMANKVDKVYSSSLIGSVMLSIGIPLCYTIGVLSNRTETIVEAI